MERTRRICITGLLVLAIMLIGCSSNTASQDETSASQDSSQTEQSNLALSSSGNSGQSSGGSQSTQGSEALSDSAFDASRGLQESGSNKSASANASASSGVSVSTSESISSASEAKTQEQSSEKKEALSRASEPYELTSENIKKAKVGDRVYATGHASLYMAYGHVGLITSSGGQWANSSLRVMIPETENASYYVDCDVCDPGEFADVFYNHAAVDFENSTVTVSGVISGRQVSDDGDYFWGVDLKDARVENVVFD